MSEHKAIMIWDEIVRWGQLDGKASDAPTRNQSQVLADLRLIVNPGACGRAEQWAYVRSRVEKIAESANGSPSVFVALQVESLGAVINSFA